MSYENINGRQTVPAAGDFATTSAQFQFLVLDSNARATIAAGGGTPILGVLYNEPGAQDRGCEIPVEGSIVKVKAGSAITKGQRVTSDSAGKGTAFTVGTSHYAGIAMETVTTANQICSILFRPGWEIIPA